MRSILLLLLLSIMGGAGYFWWYAGYQAGPIVTPINPTYSDANFDPTTMSGVELEYFDFTAWDGGVSRAAIVRKEGEESSRQLSVIAALKPEQRNHLAAIDYVLVAVEWDEGIKSAMSLAEMLTAVGLKCVLWDARGLNNRHAYCTHGLKERGDITLLINELARRDAKQNPVCVAVGQGYGATTLLQAAPEEKRLHALISIDAYASLRESLKRTMPDSPMTLAMLWLIDRRIVHMVGYECFDVAAVECVSSLNQDVPSLFINLIQGSPVVNLQDAINIYRQSASLYKQIWTLRSDEDGLDADHRLIHTRDEAFGKAVNQDFEIQLKDDDQTALIDMIAWLNEVVVAALRVDESPKPVRPNFLNAAR
ncbi:MAG: hypothetical protein R3Y56_06630 [Akkermansia sp.]